MRKSVKRVLASVFALAITCTANGLLYGANATSLNDEFVIPGLIDKRGFVGETIELARVMPADEDAVNYDFTVLDANNEEVETNGYSFLPETAGEFKCLYSYELNGAKYEYTYIVSVSVKDGPVFASEPVFPNAFVSGKQYKLPEIDAADYTSGSKVDATVTTTVTCAGQELSVTDGVFVPVYKTATDKAVITYTATSGSKVETFSVSVPVVKVTNEAGKISMTELFARKGFEKASASADKLTFTATGDAEALFANKLIAEGLDLEFGFGENDKAESIIVTMASFEDPSVSVTVEFKKGSVVLNGKTTKTYDYVKGENFRLTFDGKRNQLNGVDGNFLFDVFTDANGGEFNGFPGGIVKIGFAVKNVYGVCDLDVVKVNQYLNNSEKEMVAPNLYLEEKTTEYAVGDVVTIANAGAYDVVNPNAELRVTVQKGKTPVKDLNGNEINYVVMEEGKPISFKAESSGNYQVIYSMIDADALDVNGDPIEAELTKPIRVYDNQPPVITVGGKIKDSVKLGASLTIPKVTVADNDGGKNSTLQICMIRPTGYIDAVADNLASSSLPNKDTIESQTYKFTMNGNYRLLILAMDQYGNYQKLEYVIKCEG